ALLGLVVLPGLVGEPAHRRDRAGLRQRAEAAASEQHPRGRTGGTAHGVALRVLVGLQRVDDLVDVEHGALPFDSRADGDRGAPLQGGTTETSFLKTERTPARRLGLLLAPRYEIAARGNRYYCAGAVSTG